MADLKHGALRVLHRFEKFVDRQWRRRLGREAPVHIAAYRGHGTARELRLKGRVLAGKPPEPATQADTRWTNLQAMYRRFTSREIPGARVCAHFRGATRRVFTDEEGYFEITLRPEEACPEDRLWHSVDLWLATDGRPRLGGVEATGQVLVPPPSCAFGVISDVDDTIIKTGAGKFATMLRTTMFGNARTRLPFEGVAAFYEALQRGAGGKARGPGGASNPIFYVSSSPWNLYDFLVDFMDVQGIPAGPLFLRDLGIDETKFIQTSHRAHKLGRIERLLNTYPDLPFLLIGDSGQKDPEIYRQAMQDFPGRIQAVYIRDVTAEARRTEVQALAREVEAQHADLLLVPDTEAAAEHAAERGFINPDALPDIRTEKAKDSA